MPPKNHAQGLSAIMRWLTFIILAIVAVSLQATVAGRVSWFGARPDWVLVLVVFYALHARADDAMPAAWVVGALADLMTIERFGLLALCYGLTAMVVCGVRDLVFTGHPLTQFGVTLACGVMVQVAGLPGGDRDAGRSVDGGDRVVPVHGLMGAAGALGVAQDAASVEAPRAAVLLRPHSQGETAACLNTGSRLFWSFC